MRAEMPGNSRERESEREREGELGCGGYRENDESRFISERGREEGRKKGNIKLEERVRMVKAEK